MTKRRTPPTDYDEDDYSEYDDYGDYASDSSRLTAGENGSAPAPNATIHQAFDWGISGSILAIIILTIIYTLSPIDAVPDIVPVAGQVDDLAAILAGGGTVTFLAALRFILRSRIGRWGCLIAITLSAIGAFTLFWIVMQILDRIL